MSPISPIRLGEGIVLKPSPARRAIVRALLTARRTTARRGLRSAKRAVTASATLDAAIAETDARVVQSFEIRPKPARAPRGMRAMRSAARVGDLELETAADEAVVLLRENDDGTTTWIYPQPATAPRRMRGAAAPAGGPPRRRWKAALDLPRSSAPPPAPPARGGPRRPKRSLVVGALVGAVVKVIVFKVLGWAAAQLLEHLVRRHEVKRMVEGIKPVGATGFLPPGAPSMQPADWPAVAGKRVLVFVHGTFSDAQGAFKDLDADTLRALAAFYPGGIYAFDHFSLSKSPIENAQLFFDSLPLEQGALTIDMVTHSRGGLVARSITELNQQPNVTFGNVVFFGTPNAGTPLADPERLKECLDLLTNLTKLVAPFAGLFVLSWIVAAVQWLAANGVGKLPGLVPQDPHSEFLRRLNDPATATGARYAAVSANYEADTGLLAKLRDRGMDALFQAANDLVVPTASVTTVDPAAAPAKLLADRVYTFQGARVFHGNFFAQPEARQFLQHVLR